MFNRHFRAAEHRQHVRPPSPTSYALDPVGRTAASLDAFEQEGYDAWHRDEPAAPAANKMVMDALEGVPVGDSSTIEIMKAFSRGFERGRQEMMDREFPEMKGASRSAGWVLDDLAEAAGLSTSLGKGWSVLHTNGGGSVLHCEFSDFDGGTVSPPDVEGGPWQWSVHARLYQVHVGSGAGNTAQEAMSMVEETYAEYKRTANRKQAAEGDEVELTYEQAYELLTDRSHDAYGQVRLYGIIGEGETAGQIIGIKSVQNLERFQYDRIYTIERSGVPIFRADKRASTRRGSRRTAFLDTVHFTEPKHRVAGWNWDDHLNGFIAAEAAREFTCACGEHVPAPGYTDCRCGKRWNAYSIQANGSQKMIAREVPVRDNVVMARTASRRKIAAPSSPSDAIAQHFPGWLVDDDDGDFWEIQSPGREHAFIHEGGGVYTVLVNDNTPDELHETGLSFDEALEEMRAEGVI